MKHSCKVVVQNFRRAKARLQMCNATAGNLFADGKVFLLKSDMRINWLLGEILDLLGTFNTEITNGRTSVSQHHVSFWEVPLFRLWLSVTKSQSSNIAKASLRGKENRKSENLTIFFTTSLPNFSQPKRQFLH